MMKINRIVNVVFLLLTIILSVIPQCWSALSNKRLCYDPTCSELISLAKTTIKYPSPEKGILSFDINANVKVFSKEAGTRQDLWGIEVNGKRGYAPKDFLKEYTIYQKVLRYEVPIEASLINNKKPNKKLEYKNITDKLKPITEDVENPSVPITTDVKFPKELPNNVTPTYEVIDGTTLHLNPTKTFTQTSATEVPQKAVVPNKENTIVNLKVDSNKENNETNTSAEDDKSSQKILNNKDDHDEQNISQKENANNVVKNPEKKLADIIGVKFRPLEKGINYVKNLFKTANEEVKTVEKETIPEVQDDKVSKEQVPSETQDVQLAKEQSVSSVQDVKVAKEQPVSEVQDVKTAKDQTVSETQDVQLSKEQPSTEVQHVKTPIQQIDTENLDVHLSNKQSVSGVQDVKVTKEEPVSKVQDVKAAKDQTVSETQDVQLSKEQPSTEVQDVKTPIQQIDTENLDVHLSNKQSVSGVQDVKVAKEQSVSKVQDVKAAKDQTVSETQDVQLSKEQPSTEVQDVKTSIQQIDTENLDVQLSKEQPISDVQDIKVAQEQVPAEAQNIQLTKEQLVPQVQDVKASEEITVSKVQDVKLQQEHSTDNVSTSIDNTEEQRKNVLNITVASSTITALHETGHTDPVQTISANSSEINEKVALNITEPTNTEYIHSMENSQFETRQAKLVENSNVFESNSTIHDIKDDVHAPTETDTNSSTGSPSLNIGRILSEHSSNINFDTASHESDSENHFNSQDIQVNEEVTAIASDEEEDSKVLQKKIEADIEYEKADTLEQITNLNDNSAEYEYINLSKNIESINEFHNRNLLNADAEESNEIESAKVETAEHPNEVLLEHGDDTISVEEVTSENVSSLEVCAADNVECFAEVDPENNFINSDETYGKMKNIMESLSIVSNYWMTFMYLIITATATLIFSLGYYYIENMRRDRQLIAKINKLEKDLLVSTKESLMLKDTLKITKDKLTSIEDDSFGSNEMVLSLKGDLEASKNAKAELEDQVAMLEKDLESATEAGLELERMLREILSSDNEDNPLAQSVEDLQTRLNAQQAANESLTSALNLKTQENESLSAELPSVKKKCEELEVELIRLRDNLKLEMESKNSIQQTLTDKVQELEMKIKNVSNEKIALQKQLERKEMVAQDLKDVINQSNSNLDLDKLYNVIQIKADAKVLLEERNELKIRLTEVEGAHNLLEEHIKVVKEEVSTLSEQCKTAEKEKKDAETRLEVLSNFFKEREAQRQKEESVWLQQQGEVVSTVERIQTMQSEIQNYKQQIEMLKREVLDQEREYENQISIIETKAREQWIKARQVERRLEESKVEAGQLRNRLTLIEKNINDVDPEAKLHRMEANGETATSPPLFIGAELSNSPIMFSGSSNVPPPPPPGYLHSLYPPYLPPPLPNTSNLAPYEISQRPPPLGGRLSSPPPMPLHPPNSSRYDNTSSPPPISPHLHPSFPNLRIPPPPFVNDHIPGPLPPPLGSIMPATLGTTHSWVEEPLTPLRNSGYHLSQRERVRNHKDSLHSSGESLDKSHHNSKV